MANKCGIITFNQAINQGAVLQMYALQKYIGEKLGCDCEIIDYQSSRMKKEYEKMPIKRLLNPKVLASIIINNSYIRYNFAGFAEFNSKYIQYSKDTYTCYEELLQTNNIYDVFITGSDQVFNLFCSHFDENYFLPFVLDVKKKNSYAASIGLTDIPEDLVPKYTELLKSFNNLSLRERVGAELVNKVTGVKTQVSVDPTLLLEYNDWKAIFREVKVKEPYILIYVIAEDKRIFRFAKRLAKRYGYKILYINDRLLKPVGIKSMRNVSPDQWLSLLYNAQIVLTNSYHGILFSCNFRKTFFPFLLRKNKQVNSRIVDFLDRYKLDNLILDENSNISKIDIEQKIDYSFLDLNIKEDIRNSKTFLRDIINCKN